MNNSNLTTILAFNTLLWSGCIAPTDTTPVEPCAASSDVWVSDQGDGSYQNPVLYADYSDPDVIRVGDDFYMTASSFNCAPGLPILHSKDLVNWQIVNYALPRLVPDDNFSIPQHGNGVWAPSIRYHRDEFYIFYGDPDYGIYMLKTGDPLGKWSEPYLVKPGKGWIDPCPLWDDDGRAYLVHAWAGSRSGIKSILVVHEMSADGTSLLDEGVLVFDGHMNNQTVEGPKFYKQNGYYYILAPAGGVTSGWQLALRSKQVFGPYENKRVLHQGNTNINGPHQGAWIDTETGENWFMHFQDKGPYGRIVHLQPMQWINSWPLIGIDQNNDGIGEPVARFKKPHVGKAYPVCTPQSSDEFNEESLGLQWQWHANPAQGIGFPSGKLGYFRLNAVPAQSNFENLWQVPHLLLQKFTAEQFTATAEIEFYPGQKGDKTGLIIMGTDYAYLALVQDESALKIQKVVCTDAPSGNREKVEDSKKIGGNTFYLRVRVQENAVCSFFYSLNNTDFYPIGGSFQATPGKWIGAKAGFFCISEKFSNNAGYTNINWFRIEKL